MNVEELMRMLDEFQQSQFEWMLMVSNHIEDLEERIGKLEEGRP